MSAFVGPNGQGKTNLVEAIDYVATQSSHRVSSDQPLVRFGADQAIIRTTISQGRPAGAGRARDQPWPVQPGAAEPRRRAAGPRGARDPARRAVLARRPGPGQGRPRGATPVPRRPAGGQAAALRRRARRLRPGAQAAQQPAQDGRRARAGGRAQRERPRHAGGLGLPPGPNRRRAARRPARAGRGAAPAPGQALCRDRRRAGQVRGRQRGVGGLPAVVGPAGGRAGPRRAGRPAARGDRTPPRRRARPWRHAGRDRIATSSSSGSGSCRRADTPATASRGRWRSRCGWRPSSCSEPTATTRC